MPPRPAPGTALARDLRCRGQAERLERGRAHPANTCRRWTRSAPRAARASPRRGWPSPARPAPSRAPAADLPRKASPPLRSRAISPTARPSSADARAPRRCALPGRPLAKEAAPERVSRRGASAPRSHSRTLAPRRAPGPGRRLGRPRRAPAREDGGEARRRRAEAPRARSRRALRAGDPNGARAPDRAAAASGAFRR